MRSGRGVAETEAEWRPAGLLGDLLPGELNDACCWACSGGGDVVCCDGCRAVYHLACINMESLPDEDFFCPLCSCKECNGPCKDRHPAVSIQTEMVPVHTRPLKPRQSPSSKLPDGPGYLCPQQLRLWLQLQPTAHLEDDSESTQEQQLQEQQLESAAAAGKPSADEVDDKLAAEPRPKRQKRDSAGANSGTHSTPAATVPVEAVSAVSGDTYIRCCCCQRGCHVKCLPQEQQQQLAAWACAPQDSTDRDQNKSAAHGAKRMRSPKGKKQASKPDQEQQQRQLEQERLSRPVPPFFCGPGCRHTATELAKRCALGVTQLDALPDGTPVCWQLIQPAAVAAALDAAPVNTVAAADGAAAAETAAAAGPETAAVDKAGEAAGEAAAAAEARSAVADAFAGADPAPAPVPTSALLGAGMAPAYTQQQAHVLSQVLRDTQQLLAVQLGPVWEVRTFQHCLPWLLSGLRQPTPGGLLDLSTMHVAVLWVGCTLAAAALVRVHGGEGGGVLEVTLAATTPQLQHRRLGRMLVGAVERFAMEGCKVKQAWMPALGGVVNVVKPCVGVSVLPGWEREDGVRGRLQLAPGCSTKVLGLSVSAGGSAGGAAAGSRGQAAEDAQQKVPKGVASCWALKLQYGRAANVMDWLQLTKCPLLRYSYVPFVSKRLEPQTMLPQPHFRKQQVARPPPLPPLPPQMQMQQRFGMPGMPQMMPPPYHMQQRPMMPMQPVRGPMQGMQPVPMPMQGMPPMQMPMQGMQHMDPMAMQMQQQGTPLAVAADMPNGAAVLDLAGSAQDNGGGDGQGPEGPADAAAAAAHRFSDAAGGSSNGAQQQEEQQPAADQQVDGASAGADASKQQLEPESTAQEHDTKQQQQQQQPVGANSTPASMRVGSREWKEQVMQQFLAQQSTFGAKPVTAPGQGGQHAGPAEPAAGDKAVGAGAAESAGPDPMQE